MDYFKNDQWTVDDDGLVSKGPEAPYEYRIGAHRLLERAGAGGGRFYDWPSQVLTKTWVSEDAFIEAYRRAIEVHRERYDGDVDPDLLELSIEEGQRMKGGARF